MMIMMIILMFLNFVIKFFQFNINENFEIIESHTAPPNNNFNPFFNNFKNNNQNVDYVIEENNNEFVNFHLMNVPNINDVQSKIIIKDRYANDHTTDIFNQRIKLINNQSQSDDVLQTRKNEQLFPDNKNVKCCLVSKVLNQDNNHTFSYNYEKLDGDKCNLNLYNLDDKNQLLFDGVNNWSNTYCKNNLKNQIIGSCRIANFECLDFIDKQNCEKLNSDSCKPNKKDKVSNVLTDCKNENKMRWDQRTCNNSVYEIKPFNNYNVDGVTQFGITEVNKPD
jgi:hypothetical protein